MVDALDEDIDRFAARVVAAVFGPDPDFGLYATPAPTRHHRLLSEDVVAEITSNLSPPP